MKTIKPLKRNPALIRFSQDHHFGLLCVWKIREGLRKSIAPERISRYVLYFFETGLILHFREEEEMPFIKLPENNAMRIEAEEDHKSIYLLIEDLKQNPGNKNLLENFAEILEKHIHFEERQLFQYSQEVLSEAQLEEIAKTISAVKHVPEEAWSDSFWK